MVGQLFLRKKEIKVSFETLCSSLVTQPNLHSDHENHSDFHNERYKLQGPPKENGSPDAGLRGPKADVTIMFQCPNCLTCTFCFSEQSSHFLQLGSLVSTTMCLYLHCLPDLHSPALFLDPFEAKN